MNDALMTTLSARSPQGAGAIAGSAHPATIHEEHYELHPDMALMVMPYAVIPTLKREMTLPLIFQPAPRGATRTENSVDPVFIKSFEQ